MDQEEQEPPLIKEEQEELCISQGLDQLVVKLETDTIRVLQYSPRLDEVLECSGNGTLGCEEQMDPGSTLLDVSMKPDGKSHRTSK